MWFKTRRTDASLLDSANHRFTYDLTVDAPRAAVFKAVTDPTSMARWFPDLRDVSWISSAPHGVGSLRQVKLRGLSVREHVLVWEPGERFAFSIAKVSVPIISRMVEDFRFEDLGGRTRVRWTVAYVPKLALRPVHRVVRPVFGRLFQRASESLAAHFHAGEAAA